MQGAVSGADDCASAGYLHQNGSMRGISRQGVQGDAETTGAPVPATQSLQPWRRLRSASRTLPTHISSMGMSYREDRAMLQK